MQNCSKEESSFSPSNGKEELKEDRRNYFVSCVFYFILFYFLPKGLFLPSFYSQILAGWSELRNAKFQIKAKATIKTASAIVSFRLGGIRFC